MFDRQQQRFPALAGGHYWRNRVWVSACEAAGLEGIGFHSLRRASATALVHARVDLKTAQTRLGYSDPRLTWSIYAEAVASRPVRGGRSWGHIFCRNYL